MKEILFFNIEEVSDWKHKLNKEYFEIHKDWWIFKDDKEVKDCEELNWLIRKHWFCEKLFDEIHKLNAKKLFYFY